MFRMIRNTFLHLLIRKKSISFSRENAFICENMSPPDRDLGQLLAKSWLGGETFSSYELNFLLVKISIMAGSRCYYLFA